MKQWKKYSKIYLKNKGHAVKDCLKALTLNTRWTWGWSYNKWYNISIRLEVCCKKKVFLEILQISQENTFARVYFLIKFINFNKVINFIKNETLEQVFFCEFCEISKITFSYRTPLVAASGTKLIHQLLDKLGADIINVNDKLKENVKDRRIESKYPDVSRY